jgi:hypothetical protein
MYPNRIHPVPETFRILEKKLIWNPENEIAVSNSSSGGRTCIYVLPIQKIQ